MSMHETYAHDVRRHDFAPFADHDRAAPERARGGDLRDRLQAAFGVASVAWGVVRLLQTIRRRPRAASDWTLRSNGARQILGGLGLVGSPRWLLLRVAGDALDLALLRAEIMASRRARARLHRAIALTLATTAIDAISAHRARR